MPDNNLRPLAAGSDLPAPPEFPVAWTNPADSKLLWILNPRSKAPVPPLSYGVMAAFLMGGNPGYALAGLPFQMRSARLNTYSYMGVAPIGMPPEPVLKVMMAVNRTFPALFQKVMGTMSAGMTKQQLAALNPILDRFETYWYEELLPEIKQHSVYFDSYNLRGLSLEQLRVHFSEGMLRLERMGALHMMAVLPTAFSLSQFEEAYCRLFPGATSLDAMRLVQGFDNKTLEGNRALWQLSRDVLASPTLHQLFTQLGADGVVAGLEGSEEGQVFLVALRAHLAQYGQRLHSLTSVESLSWIEKPTPAIQCLQLYLTQPHLRPEAEQAAQTAQRESAVAAARARLAGYAPAQVAEFERLLKAAQVGAVVHEDHNFWIDQRLFYQLRRLILEMGRRLNENGSLDTISDVFYLTPEDLGGNGDSISGTLPERRFQGLVRERQAEIAHFGRLTPPPMLGRTPPFDIEDGGPAMRAFFKGDFEPQGIANGNPRVIKGVAGSAGVMRGQARVLRSLDEASKLQAGDVLVAEYTLPPWTALFATAGAVVTDVGGLLSHSAIVAREYGIPAVVGTGLASKSFHDGQWLEVDGNAGTVRVV